LNASVVWSNWEGSWFDAGRKRHAGADRRDHDVHRAHGRDRDRRDEARSRRWPPRAVWLQNEHDRIEWTERLRKSRRGASAVRRRPGVRQRRPATSGELLILASGPRGEVRRDEGLRFHGVPTFWMAAGAGSETNSWLNNWLVDLGGDGGRDRSNSPRPRSSTLNSSSMSSLRSDRITVCGERRPQHSSKETFPPELLALKYAIKDALWPLRRRRTSTATSP